MTLVSRMRAVAAIMLLAAAGAALAQTCNSSTPDDAPASRYKANGNGTVTDLRTGLMWTRCALGQTWDSKNSTCSGAPTADTWQGALKAVQAVDQGGGYAGYTDWRLPNLRELMSIARYHCYDPAINETIFPATSSGPYWSSTPMEASFGVGWTVDFSTGQAVYNGYGNKYPIRMVRAGAFFP